MTIAIRPLTATAFASFGDVIELGDSPDFMINNGKCGRHHDLANIDFQGGKTGISLFEGQPYTLPLSLKMMERHPLGSQAFLPLSDAPFLIIVAHDNNGQPAQPQAFISNGKQGVNYHRNVWHGVLTPLDHPQVFAVIDRIGDGNNLQEHHFESAHIIKND